MFYAFNYDMDNRNAYEGRGLEPKSSNQSAAVIRSGKDLIERPVNTELD